MKAVLFSVYLLLTAFGANAQELRIGHLETADDTGINWLFYHCNQNGQVLKCDVFQTLIFKNMEPMTCSVVNDHSEEIFTWNPPTQSWISQEGPTGPCGRITVGTLELDQESKRFWKYTMKKITTNQAGVWGNGLSCKQVPDMTLRYTWKAANNAGCAYIKNLMN